jgi:hypothetical protein
VSHKGALEEGLDGVTLFGLTIDIGLMLILKTQRDLGDEPRSGHLRLGLKINGAHASRLRSW